MDRRAYLGAVAASALSTLGGCVADGPGFGSSTSTGTPTPVVDRSVPGDGDVAQYGANPANTGVHAESGPTDEVEAYWRRTPARYDNSQPAVVGDALYVAFEGTLVALDRASGEQRWSTRVGHDGATAPSVHGGTVYATVWNGGPDTDRGLAAVDASSGEVLWRGATDLNVGTAPTVTTDGVFLGGGHDNATVTAFDHDGTERWRRDLGEYASTPAVGAGTVCYGAGTRAVVTLDAATGERRWRHATDGHVTAAPALTGGTLVVGDRDGTLYALDVSDGAERWTADVDASVRHAPATTDDLVVAATDEGVVAHGHDGHERWRADLDGRPTAPAVAGDAVYLGARRTLHAVSADDGSSLWTFETRERTYTDVVLGGIRGGPAVTRDTVFVATQAGDAYAVGEV